MAHHRHQRETNARRPQATQVAGTVALLATMSAVTLGVLTATPPTDESLATSTSAIGSPTSTLRRDPVVSRSESRLQASADARREARAEAARAEARAEEQAKARAKQAKQAKQATLTAIRNADTRMWTTTDLNVWTAPDQQADQVGVLDGLEKVLVTGRADDGRVELVIDGAARWVSAGYLADEKPETGPTLGGACTNGSSVSSGVHTGVVLVHEAVCASFPAITTYGTFRGDGEHAEGRAVDVMTSGETGWAVADFLRANYAALDIEYIIYSQNIWSVERSSEGWRSMSDRGSTTANHYDHVHVTVY